MLIISKLTVIKSNDKEQVDIYVLFVYGKRRVEELIKRELYTYRRVNSTWRVVIAGFRSTEGASL